MKRLVSNQNSNTLQNGEDSENSLHSILIVEGSGEECFDSFLASFQFDFFQRNSCGKNRIPFIFSGNDFLGYPVQESVKAFVKRI
ncbi:hypothetical protein DLM78_14830 [Leptospira stimsonii]|uniref:Uncharacterized protein n=1 Tax=Leptospira stimsonii TaxID=2202203 RepID=A0A8B3CP97_9LEPT|nr:hypothetical protein DLM78_14830 [Leptospira stimsonii]